MATSGTTAFDLNIDDIIEEAYERVGLQTNSGQDLKSARRSLNIMFSEWGNRGVHLWKVELKEQLLTAGTATYTAPTNANDILEAYVSTTTGTTSTSFSFYTLYGSRSCLLFKYEKKSTSYASNENGL